MSKKVNSSQSSWSNWLQEPTYHWRLDYFCFKFFVKNKSTLSRNKIRFCHSFDLIAEQFPWVNCYFNLKKMSEFGGFPWISSSKMKLNFQIYECNKLKVSRTFHMFFCTMLGVAIWYTMKLCFLCTTSAANGTEIFCPRIPGFCLNTRVNILIHKKVE